MQEMNQGLPVQRHVESQSLSRSQEPSYSQYSSNQYWNPSTSSSNVYSSTQSQAPRDGTNGNWHMSQGLGQGTYPSSSSQSYPQHDASSISAVETLTASFQAQVALPSKEQVQTYLVQHMKKPLGLYQGWKVEGIQLNIYELFSSVLRAGGSSGVSRQNLWPVVATILHLPAAPGTNGMRSSPAVGNVLRRFFLELLGGLEILWDQTRNLDGTRAEANNRPSQPPPQVQQAEPQSSRPHYGPTGRYDERSQPQVQPVQRTENAYNRTGYGTSAQPAYTAPTSDRYDTQIQTQEPSGSRQHAPVAQQTSSAPQSQRHVGTMAPSDMHLHQMSNNSATQAAPATSAPQEAAPVKPKKTKKKKQDPPAPVEAPAPPPSPPVPEVVPETNGTAKRKRRTPAEMIEHRAAKAAEKEAKAAEKENKASKKAGTKVDAVPEPVAGPSASAREPTPPPLVPATAEEPKKKRKRRSKAEIEADNARKGAKAKPALVYHENGIVRLDTFDELVNTGYLPLPPAAPDVVSEKPGTGARYYAARCQELRTAVKRNRDNTPYRDLSDDEIHFWNALVSILKHNPSITVPGADYFANQEAAEAEAAAAAAIEAKKKGGRPKLPRDEDGNVIRDPEKLAALKKAAPESGPVKRKASPERDEAGKVVKRVRGRLRGDGYAKYVNEDGEISWRLPPGQVAAAPDAPKVAKSRPMPRPTHHSITAQAFEAQAQAVYRPMESMMSVFGANPARAYAREENQQGQAIVRRNLAYPGSNEKRVVEISKRTTPAKLLPHYRPIRIIGVKVDSPEPPQVDSDSSNEDEAEDVAEEVVEPAVEEVVQKEPSLPPPPRFVLDSIEFGFLPPATLRKYKNPEEPEAPLQINSIGVDIPAMVDDQFADYEPLPEWEDEEGANIEPVVETPTRQGTRSNPAPAAHLMPTPVAARLNKQMQKGPKGKVLGAPQRSRLSVVSYPRGVTPPEPRRTRSGLVEKTPVSRRPIKSNKRIEAVQSEPRKTRSGLVHQVATPPQSARPAKDRRPREVVHVQSTPRRTLSGMVIAATPTPPPEFDLYEEGDITPPLESMARNARDVPPRMTRSSLASQPGPSQSKVTRQKTAKRTSIPTPPEPRRTRSRLAETQPAKRDRRTAKEMVQRKVAKPKAISRQIISVANSARRLRSMRWNMSLRKGNKGKKDDRIKGDDQVRKGDQARKGDQVKKVVQVRKDVKAQKGDQAKKVDQVRKGSQKVDQAKAAKPSKQAVTTKSTVPKAQKQVVEIVESSEESDAESDEECNDDGRGLPVIELPTRNKVLARTGGFKSNGVDRAVVALPIRANTRFNLVQAGAYDPDEDDESEHTSESDSEVELISVPYTAKRHANIRARTPEPIPVRFPARGVREQNPLLAVQSLLARTIEHPCGWKGCGAVLASEELSRKHVHYRDHAFEGRMAGQKQTLWRCLWDGCGLSVFRTQSDLAQHLSAKHVARVLRCPFEFCDATSPTVQHLGRHIDRHHEDEEPLPLSNLTQLLEPVEPQDDLPGEIPIERLAAPDVAPASYGPGGRDTWVRERVQAKCFAPAEPEMRVRHPVHILQHMDGEPDVSDEEEEDEDVTVPRSWPGRKIAVVEIPTVKRGMNRAPRVADQSLVEATSDDVEDEWEDVDDTQLDEGILKEEVWINGDMEDDSEGLKDDDGAEVVVDEDDDGAEDVDDEDGDVGDETAKWGDETLALVDYPDSEDDEDEVEDEDEGMDVDVLAVTEETDRDGADPASEDDEQIGEDEEDVGGGDEMDLGDSDDSAPLVIGNEGELDDIEAEADDESDADMVDFDSNQVRFDFDMGEAYVQTGEYLAAYEQVGTPFALAASPRPEDDDEASSDVAEAVSEGSALLEEQATQDLIRAVQTASEVQDPIIEAPTVEAAGNELPTLEGVADTTADPVDDELVAAADGGDVEAAGDELPTTEEVVDTAGAVDGGHIEDALPADANVPTLPAVAEAVPTDGPLNLERVEVEEVVNVTAGHVDDGYIADALSVDSPTPNLAQPIINEATMTDVPLNVERAMEEAVVNVTAGPIDATALAADPLIPDLALPVVSEVAPAEAQQNAELAPGESVTVSAAMPNLALATATPNLAILAEQSSTPAIPLEMALPDDDDILGMEMVLDMDVDMDVDFEL